MDLGLFENFAERHSHAFSDRSIPAPTLPKQCLRDTGLRVQG